MHSLQLIPTKPRFYVTVEGPIGVGKTTLARILQQELGGQLLLEVFEENPFLSDFYADRARYAFQTQIFFLLSRYRQQHGFVAAVLQADSLVSDYLFAKDRLFAHLNLVGDELAVYERVHAALGEKIPPPGLVLHLRANTDVLMNRIATRDRSYERDMSRQYIEDLRIAYERFFADYDQAPVLSIDTSNLDFVAKAEDRRHIVGLVRAALERGPYQQPLPQLEPTLGNLGAPVLRQDERRLADFQRWQRLQAAETGFIPDLYLNYLELTEEVGALGRELKRLWVARYQQDAASADSPRAALPEATQESLRNDLASLLAHLLKLANDAGIDLEDAYVQKVRSI